MKDVISAILWTIFACMSFATSIDSMVTYQMRISLTQFPLPISMSNLLTNSLTQQKNNFNFIQIQSINVKMGHMTGTNKHFLFPRGISMYIQTKPVDQIIPKLLKDDYLTQIKSILQISQDKRFQTYLQQQNMLVVSDPNDRFCTQHIEYYLRYFFPCKNFASLGLDKLINPSKLFEKYLAFEFKWLAHSNQIHMKFIFPKQKEILPIDRQTKCGHIKVYDISKQNSQNSLLSFYSNKVQYSGESINRWYTPNKCIIHTFKLTQIHNTSRIKLITMLPLGFIFDDFQVYPENSQVSFNHNKIGSSLFLTFAVDKISRQTKQIKIQINFHSSLPPFQNFQTIAGGGQEIINIPLYFEEDKMYHLYSKIISQRLLEPDFSIPFQTITWTIGIIGYLWINLWRIHKFKHKKTKKQ